MANASRAAKNIVYQKMGKPRYTGMGTSSAAKMPKVPAEGFRNSADIHAYSESVTAAKAAKAAKVAKAGKMAAGAKGFTTVGALGMGAVLGAGGLAAYTIHKKGKQLKAEIERNRRDTNRRDDELLAAAKRQRERKR